MNIRYNSSEKVKKCSYATYFNAWPKKRKLTKGKFRTCKWRMYKTTLKSEL